MSMKRTIFEIPVSLQPYALQKLEEHGLIFSCSLLHNSNLAEVSITHDKQQDYILELLDREIEEQARLISA